MSLIGLVEFWSWMPSWDEATRFAVLSSTAEFVVALCVGLAGGLSLSGSI